ncbi:hypothetical protein PspLS_07114 [Pyricularia sp. CBS 133598]|nr:hypothetical protein PspLS_07114 [Pyricularia sp. CBS 133598]
MTDAKYGTADYTVGWISIIATGLAASKGFLDKQRPPIPKDKKDNNTYMLGSMGTHNVVMAAPGKSRMENTPAANIIGDIIRSFSNLRFNLLVCITDGAPTVKNVRLGDVVVGIPLSNALKRPIDRKAITSRIALPKRWQDLNAKKFIPSGNRKIEDAVFRDKHAKETEAAGVVNRYNCLVVRDICDYTDSYINKQ